MSDKTTTIAEIKKHIQDFSDARGWRKDQNVKDLVMALSVETPNLLRFLCGCISTAAGTLPIILRKPCRCQQNR